LTTYRLISLHTHNGDGTLQRLITHRTQQRADRVSAEHVPRNPQHCTDFCMKTMGLVHRCTLADEVRNSSALTAPVLVHCETMMAIWTGLGVDNTTGY